jgi:hypothetical protein
MTVRRIRDLKRELTAVAEPFGAMLVDIKSTGSSHLCATMPVALKYLISTRL